MWGHAPQLLRVRLWGHCGKPIPNSLIIIFQGTAKTLYIFFSREEDTVPNVKEFLDYKNRAHQFRD